MSKEKWYGHRNKHQDGFEARSELKIDALAGTIALEVEGDTPERAFMGQIVFKGTTFGKGDATMRILDERIDG